MNLYDYIQDGTLFIVPSFTRQKILRTIDEKGNFYRLKFMTMGEFLERFLFSYDEEALVYFSKTYHVKPSIAKIYLEHMKYIESANIPSLEFLQKQKVELDEKSLLHRDALFPSILALYRVVVSGDVSPFERKILERIEQITSVTILDQDEVVPHSVPMYSFLNASFMVSFVANEVMKLVKQGVSLNSIYLMNVGDEVSFELERTFSLYGIPLRNQESSSLYGTYFGAKVKKVLETAMTFQEIEEALQEEECFPMFLNVLNRYSFYEGNVQDIKEFLLEELRNCQKQKVNYEEAVSIVPFSSLIQEGCHVFLFDFNQDFPTTYKDEDFFRDDVKKELGLWTSTEKNLHSRTDAIRDIYSFSNITLLYRKMSNDGEMYPSSLLDELLVEKKEVEPTLTIYSPLSKKLDLARKFDLHQKYGIIDQEGKELAGFYQDIGYQSYQHAYTSISVSDFLEHCNHHLTLSYSDLNQFYECSFAYYLSKILKLDAFEESFYTIVGNVFHAVLATCFSKPDFSFEKSWQQEVSKYSFDARGKFFLTKLKSDLEFIIATIRKQMTVSSFDHILCEKRIEIPKHVPGLDITFKGFVDKILYTEDMGMTYVAIIDYKTGNPELNLKLAEYGLSLQLPVYLYLVSKSHLFSNVKFTGFYLQKILNNEITIQKGKAYQEQKEDNLKLQGYTNSSSVAMMKIDQDYASSSVVKGLKCKKNGEISSNSKVKTDAEMDALVSLVDQKIDECIESIVKADFTINPKVINGKNESCGYCPFRAICYHDDRDLIRITTVEKEGEEDAEMDE